jgi:DNA polymerase epsilon subunit 2
MSAGPDAFRPDLQAKLQRISQAHEDLSFVVLSDVWLDHPKTIPALKRMFEGYGQAEFRPYAFILCGNFSMKGWMGAGSMESYIGKSSHFVE